MFDLARTALSLLAHCHIEPQDARHVLLCIDASGTLARQSEDAKKVGTEANGSKTEEIYQFDDLNTSGHSQGSADSGVDTITRSQNRTVPHPHSVTAPRPEKMLVPAVGPKMSTNKHPIFHDLTRVIRECAKVSGHLLSDFDSYSPEMRNMLLDVTFIRF